MLHKKYNIAYILFALVIISLSSPLALSLGPSYNTEPVNALLIKLPDDVSSKTNLSLLITLLVGNEEVELPYTYVRIGSKHVSWPIDYVYHGRKLSQMTVEEKRSLIEKIMNGEVKPGEVKPLYVNYTLAINSRAKGIIVLLPRGFVKDSDPYYNGWFKTALFGGYYNRLVYVYDRHIVYVYYKFNSSSVGSGLLPLKYYNTTLAIREYEYNPSINNIIAGRHWEYYYSTLRQNIEEIPVASFMEKQHYQYKVGNTGGGLYLWYSMIWSKTHMDNSYRKLKLSPIANSVLTGSSRYELSDYFYTVHNETRYELWVWILPDKDVMFRAEIYINDNLVFDQYLDLEGYALFGIGIIVKTSENPGDYFPVGKNSVKIIFDDVIDPSAKLGLHSSIVGRSYVVIKQNSDYYRAYDYFHGVGDIYNTYMDQERPIDRRYEYMYSKDFTAYLMTPNLLYESMDEYPFYYYPYIYVYVESSDDQLYDRYIDVILNGNLVAHVKTYSSVPNETAGKRYAYIAVSGDVLNSLLTSLRTHDTVNLVVRIEGYKRTIDSKWYIKYGYLGYLSRPVASTIGQFGNEFAPVQYYSKVLSFIPVYDYAGVELAPDENHLQTDIAEYSLQIITSPFHTGSQGTADIQMKINFADKIVSKGYLTEIVYVGKTVVSMKIHSSKEIFLMDANAMIARGNRQNKNPGVVSYGLWAVSMGLVILSFFSDSILIGAVSLSIGIIQYPGFYVYGETVDYTAKRINSNTYLVEATYDPGWEFTNATSYTLFASIYPFPSWNTGDYVKVSYTYKSYFKYETIDSRPPTTSYERPGYHEYQDVVYIYPYS